MKRELDVPEFLSEPEEMALVERESERLRRQAHRWGVEITDDVLATAEDGSLFIGAPHHTRIALKIRDARRETIRFWAGVLVPLVTALTGLTGTILGILSLLRTWSP